MTWFADGAPVDYGIARPDWAIGAGWLDPGHDWPKGPVPEMLVPRLEAMVARMAERASMNFLLTLSFGFHPCPFCGGAVTGSGEVVVPDPGVRAAWVAPRLIVHYIRDHGYRPPDAFVRAVEECPEHGSPAYCARMSAITGTDWSVWFA